MWSRLLVLLLIPTLAQAEWYGAGDMLHTQFGCPAVDGTWKQDLITGGSQCDTGSLAWDAGVGYRFAGEASPWTSRWSLEAGYRNWGSIGVGGRWVSDEQYTEVMQHGEAWLDEHGVTPQSYDFVDRIDGGYLRAAKGFDIGFGLEPYLSAGIFAGAHHMGKRDRPAVFDGIVAGPTVGGGVKYEVSHGIKLRVSVDAHWTFLETKHPATSQFTTVGGGLEIPLTGW